MNRIREIQKINDHELRLGIAGTLASWHAQYSKSPWVYVGNLDFSLTEGDVICVMSQFGEIEDFHLVRDDATGKSKGFAFCKYEDARSCVLAVDNFCGVQLCDRPIRVDHMETYRLPKHLQKEDSDATDRSVPGHAYHGQELATSYDISKGQDLFAKPEEPGTSYVDAEQEAKRQRKEERRRLREDKDDRKREREARRALREGRKREKKSKKSSKRHKSHKSEKRGVSPASSRSSRS